MGCEWPLVSLGEIVSIRSGYAFKSGDWRDSGVPAIKIANIKPGRVDLEGCSYVAPEVALEAKEFNVNVGDILVAMTGYVGEVACATEQDIPAVVNQRVGKLKLNDTGRVDNNFLYAYLRLGSTKAVMESLAHGSAQPNLSASHFHAIKMQLPPIAVQQQIGGLASVIDDKIANNRALAINLESIARAIFKSWFVDFDPVRAKAAGQQPTGLDADIAALFPDRLVDSEIGEIPEGWRVNSIDDIAEVVGGGTPSTKNDNYWVGGNHAWATPKDLSGLSSPVLLDTDRKLTDEGITKVSSGLLPSGTVLMSSRAPIGYLAISSIPVSVNQGFIAMTAKRDASNLFILYWAKFSLNLIKSNANGSTFQEISKKNFRPLPVVHPGNALMGVFQEVVSPIFERLECAEKENRTLAALRDTLLPHLISGKLRVADAEQAIANAV